jgi:hypothetical protein
MIPSSVTAVTKQPQSPVLSSSYRNTSTAPGGRVPGAVDGQAGGSVPTGARADPQRAVFTPRSSIEGRPRHPGNGPPAWQRHAQTNQSGGLFNFRKRSLQE